MTDNFTKLNESIASLMADLEDFTKTATATAGDTAREAAAKLRESARIAKERGQDLQEKASRHTKETARKVDDTVRDHPWEAVAAAAAVGILVGLLLQKK